MDEYTLSDFLVLSVTLRTTYLNIVGDEQISVDELQKIANNLAELTSVIVQLTDQSKADLPALSGELVKTEVFEDILMLLMQIAFVLSQSGIDVASLQEQLQSLRTNLGGSFDDMIYQTLATEILIQRINEFPQSLEWKDHFDDLDADTQELLKDIDAEVREFANLADAPESRRFSELLHAVFFDCYLGFQQDSRTDRARAYDYLIREPYQRRFRKHKTYQPTNKKILCSYSSVLDFPIRLNNSWLFDFIEEIAKAVGKGGNKEVVLHEIGEFLQKVDYDFQSGQSVKLRTKIQEESDLLEAILGYIKITGHGGDLTSKFDVYNEDPDRKYDLIDLLSRTIQTEPVLGGAAATGAEMLLAHKEKQVYMLMPFIPKGLIEKLPESLKVLWYADDDNNNKQLKVYYRAELPKMDNHPVIHNFVIEFAQERNIKKRLIYCTSCGAGVMPHNTDRVIMKNRFAYYQPDRSVNRTKTARNERKIRVNGFAGFDSSINPALSEAHCEALANQIADMEFKLFIAAGLQSLFPKVHTTTENELARLVQQGTKVHSEISGTGNFEWLINIIPQYIYSVGIGEELASFFDMINRKKFKADSTAIERFPEEKRQDKLSVSLQNKPIGYQQVMRALEVAHSLQLKRLYVHLLDMDIIIREGDLSQFERLKEIEAGLVAKWVVLRKLMSMGVISLDQSRDTMTQVKEEGFAALIETAQAIYEDLNSPPSGAIELYGIYFEKYKRTVILIPVRWVYGSMQDQLRIVGAGDTTSTISAVQAILSK